MKKVSALILYSVKAIIVSILSLLTILWWVTIIHDAVDYFSYSNVQDFSVDTNALIVTAIGLPTLFIFPLTGIWKLLLKLDRKEKITFKFIFFRIFGSVTILTVVWFILLILFVGET